MQNESVRKLIGELSDSDPQKRAAAAEQLAHCQEPPSGAAAALARACRDPDEDVRQWATSALEDLGPPARELIDELIELTRDPNDDVCYWAVTLLGRAGAAAVHATGDILGVLSNRASADVRRRAIWALGQIGPTPEIIEALAKAAADSNTRLARAAQETLAALRQNGKKH